MKDKYQVEYTEESQAHIEGKKMDRFVIGLIAVLFITYLVF